MPCSGRKPVHNTRGSASQPGQHTPQTATRTHNLTNFLIRQRQGGPRPARSPVPPHQPQQCGLADSVHGDRLGRAAGIGLEVVARVDCQVRLRHCGIVQVGQGETAGSVGIQFNRLTSQPHAARTLT